jgi:hypothetical protein
MRDLSLSAGFLACFCFVSVSSVLRSAFLFPLSNQSLQAVRLAITHLSPAAVILEVGAGTGGTTAAVLRQLRDTSQRCAVIVTDIARSLVAGARRALASAVVPGLVFDVFDMGACGLCPFCAYRIVIPLRFVSWDSQRPLSRMAERSVT